MNKIRFLVGAKYCDILDNACSFCPDFRQTLSMCSSNVTVYCMTKLLSIVTLKIERFVEIVNVFYASTVFVILSILDVCQCSKYPFNWIKRNLNNIVALLRISLLNNANNIVSLSRISLLNIAKALCQIIKPRLSKNVEEIPSKKEENLYDGELYLLHVFVYYFTLIWWSFRVRCLIAVYFFENQGKLHFLSFSWQNPFFANMKRFLLITLSCNYLSIGSNYSGTIWSLMIIGVLPERINKEVP